MKAINTRSFEKQDNKPFEKTFFIIYVKFKSSQNTLNILREKTKRVYWIYVCKMFTV